MKSEYCASKFALRGFSDALRCELREQGIAVVQLHPNTTRSEFFDHLSQTEKVAVNPFSMSPQNVAKKLVLAIERKQSDVTLTVSGRTMVWVQRLLPNLVSQALSRFGGSV